MRSRLYTVDRDGPGRLSTMARPRNGDWLVAEMRGLRSAGIDRLVSLLTDEEVAELDLAGEPDAAATAGISFQRAPMADLVVPDRDSTVALACDLRQRLGAGAGVAVHCRHGIGRSSVVVAAVLVLDGVPPADAWLRIAAARGLPVPDTAEQRAFIHTLVPST